MLGRLLCKLGRHKELRGEWYCLRCYVDTRPEHWYEPVQVYYITNQVPVTHSVDEKIMRNML